MLYKFKSRVAPDLIMLERDAKTLLTLIGKTPVAQGIIEPQQMPAAIAALNAALTAASSTVQSGSQSAAPQEVNDPFHSNPTHPDEANPGEPVITLGQRAYPFIKMLQRCAERNEPVLWGA